MHLDLDPDEMSLSEMEWCFEPPIHIKDKNNIDVENNIKNTNSVESISNLNELTNKLQKMQIEYDDDSFIFSNRTATTAEAGSSDESVGNASIITLRMNVLKLR